MERLSEVLKYNGKQQQLELIIAKINELVDAFNTLPTPTFIIDSPKKEFHGIDPADIPGVDFIIQGNLDNAGINNEIS